MTDPDRFTAEQASDPHTPGQVLADIAALRPDLRPAVAGNPGTYQGLLDWLTTLNEPAVNAAIVARARQAQPTQQVPPPPRIAPTQQLPAMPPGPPLMSQWGGRQPSTQQGPPQFAGSLPQGGMPPMYGYGAQPPKGSNSNALLWIVLGVIALLIIGLAAFFSLRGGSGDSRSTEELAEACTRGDADACEELIGSDNYDPDDLVPDPADDVADDAPEEADKAFDEANDATDAISEGMHGSDPLLDPLWDKCEAGIWQECDDLYKFAPAESDYWDFGNTCGNRTTREYYCVEELGGGDHTGYANTYGDEASFDGAWDACEAGDWEQCDELWRNSHAGTEYEAFGDTCGERIEQNSGEWCVDAMG